MDFDSYTVALLLARDDPPVLSDRKSESVQDAHLAHLADLHLSGDLLVAGAIPGPPEQRLRGLSLMRGTVDQTSALTNHDPGAVAGLWDHELHTWLVPRGLLSFTPGRLPRTMAEATGGLPPTPTVGRTVGLSLETYIRTTTDDLWHALTAPDVVPQWRFGMSFETDWSVGAPLRSHAPDGAGVVTASHVGRTLAYRWTSTDPGLNGGQASEVRFELSIVGETTRLIAQHTGLQDGSSFLQVVTGGWPMMLASLKSLLETGSALRLH